MHLTNSHVLRKGKWALRWINDKRSSFATETVLVEVLKVFLNFMVHFCAIFWLKKRGLMPGLTFSNELISRDEALHTQFAVLLYSKLEKTLSKKKIHDIIKEAVEIYT